MVILGVIICFLVINTYLEVMMNKRILYILSLVMLFGPVGINNIYGMKIVKKEEVKKTVLKNLFSDENSSFYELNLDSLKITWLTDGLDKIFNTSYNNIFIDLDKQKISDKDYTSKIEKLCYAINGKIKIKSRCNSNRNILCPNPNENNSDSNDDELNVEDLIALSDDESDEDDDLMNYLKNNTQ
jgi:hypothetical protein